MKIVHYRNWISADFSDLYRSESFSDLARLALDLLRRTGNRIDMVSGPISTGGVGTLLGNRKVFEGVIEILFQDPVLNVFSQMPFEDKMVELYRQWHVKNPSEKYCTPILEEFYEPLFSSGRVSTLHFIHDWQSSRGARWEHEGCTRWGIRKNYLSRELSIQALNGSQATK